MARSDSEGDTMAPIEGDPLREIRQRERDGEKVTVEIGPFTALMLIAALQTAYHYPTIPHLRPRVVLEGLSPS